MRTHVSQYYGRGGARIRMSRPRIEPEAWNQNWFATVADWQRLVKRIPELLFQTRFVNLLAVILAIILFNYWLSSHYHREIHDTTKKIKREQKLSLVLQYQAPPPPKISKPKPKEVKPPEPKLLQPKPVAEMPKPKPKPVAQPKPTPKSKPKPVVQPKPTPKPEPVKKRVIDLESGLNIEKDFHLPQQAQKQPRIPPPKATTAIRDELAPAADVKTDFSPIKTGLALDNAADKFQDIGSVSDRKIRIPSAKISRPDYNQDEEIVVAIQETDSYDFSEVQPTSAKAAPVSKIPDAAKSDKGLSEIKFAESGVSLIQLKACGPIEETIKVKLAALVKKKGYRKECIDETGNYQFHWPSERFTVPHFNVIIYTSQGRIATDRCEELTNACECLENN